LSVRSRLDRLGAARWRIDPAAETAPPVAGFEPPAAQALRLLTLNVAHGRKLATHQALLSPVTVRRNLEEIAALLRGAHADVVALQEADGPSAWSGNFDHVALLARLCGHAAHFRGEHNSFGLRRAALASGTALLSRHPFHSERSLRFGTTWRDTKGFVLATVPVAAWHGLELDVVSLHLEPFNPVVRRQQVRQLADELTGRRRPLVVLGDFNCSWSDETRQLRPLARELRLRPYQPYHRAPTYPARRPWRRLDWILASPELEFTAYRTLPNPVSDHLGVAADLVLRQPQPAARKTGGEPAA
jgi:endonuclease/exonuclease/phosphatase family metal-dependent hydrolase